jgi:hypothetical protein
MVYEGKKDLVKDVGEKECVCELGFEKNDTRFFVFARNNYTAQP